MSESGTYQCRLGTSSQRSEPVEVEFFQIFIGSGSNKISKREFEALDANAKLQKFRKLRDQDQINIVSDFKLEPAEVVILYDEGLSDTRRGNLLLGDDTVSIQYAKGMTGMVIQRIEF